ncbi:MAG: MutH/Sau3AI family endonuclease [Candidatus Nanohaloarchaea archaeon]
MSHEPIGRDASRQEIEEACDALLCKTTEEISEAIHERTEADRAHSKAAISHLIEDDYFGIPQNTSEEPDFEEAGIELKVTPLHPNDSKGELLRPKERLVISMVDYNDIVEADHWTDVPALDKKLHDVLLIWYVHLEEDRSGYPIIWWTIWSPTEEQSEMIQEDFELIKEKVEEGERLRTRMGEFLGTCPKHNSNFIKENPEESESGALVGSHPTREYEQRRGWQIKTSGMLDILEDACGIEREKRGRATGINRNRIWGLAEEKSTELK